MTDSTGERSNLSGEEEEYSSGKQQRSKTGSGRWKKGGHTRSSSATSTILAWLDGNYSMKPGSCIARSELYAHYEDFCRRQAMKPHTPASFGKIVRVKFPKLSTRRLGTRGQSKYHYYGLGIKESSLYYQKKTKVDLPKKGLTRFANSERSNAENFVVCSKQMIATLPSFPFFKDIGANSLPQNKVETFMLMYSSHCQRIFESTSRGHFQEVEDFLIHFWKGMPSHMLPSLENQILLDIIVVYDTILYNSLCSTLIPDTLTAPPESVYSCSKEEMLLFSQRLTEWLVEYLSHLPPSVSSIKIQTAKMFGKSLRQHVNLLESAKSVRYVLSTTELTAAAATDMQRMDRTTLDQHIKAVTMKSQCLNAQEIATEFAMNLQELLSKQSTMEDFLLWIDGIIQEYIIKVSGLDPASKLDLFYDFYLVWNCFVSYVEVETITTKAKSQETFRVLFLFLTEYIVYIIELMQSERIEEHYSRSILSRGKDPDQYCTEESIRPFIYMTSCESTRPLSLYFNADSRQTNDFLSSANSYDSSIESPLSEDSCSLVDSPFLHNYPLLQNTAELTNLFESACQSEPVSPQIDLIIDERELENGGTIEIPYFNELQSHLPQSFNDIIESTDKLLGNPWQ